MLQLLDAAALRAWCLAGRDALVAARAEIDGLNVFPVPDGDTGTNLLLTLEAVLAQVREAPPDDVREVSRAMAEGALTGARGNSGVLLSQLLRGLADELADGPADGAGLAQGLARGAELARDALGRPVEGTLLSVASGAARAAQSVRGDLPDVAAAALDGARTALAATPGQLAVLRRAGVVDAGGRGWVVLLEALDALVSAREPATAAALPPPLVRRARGAVDAVREAGSEAFAYEVQYLLRGADDGAVTRLRADLAALGDCVAVVGSAGLHNVHVHVDDVGAAIEVGLAAGRPYRILVTRFADQVAHPAAAPTRVVVAVAAGAGLVRLLRGAGALVLDAAAGAPSSGQLAAAVRATGATEAVLLPGSPGLTGAADAAAAALAPDVRAEVVAAPTAVQGLAALAVADPGRPLAADVAAMAAAAGATRAAAVRRAAAAADTAAGACVPGDALGLVDGRVQVVGADPAWVAARLLDGLLDGAELLTVVVGAAAPEGLGEHVRTAALERRTDLEVLVLDGGQPDSLLLLGAE